MPGREPLAVGQIFPVHRFLCTFSRRAGYNAGCGCGSELRAGTVRGTALWSPAGELRKNDYGIAEPGETAEVFPDVIFSPCVAFNRRGFRLGNGKGFFDRYLMLPQVRAAAPQTVAVGYEALLTDAFASEPHDVAFGWTATEKGVVKAL